MGVYESIWKKQIQFYESCAEKMESKADLMIFQSQPVGARLLLQNFLNCKKELLSHEQFLRGGGTFQLSDMKNISRWAFHLSYLEWTQCLHNCKPEIHEVNMELPACTVLVTSISKPDSVAWEGPSTYSAMYELVL